MAELRKFLFERGVAGAFYQYLAGKKLERIGGVGAPGWVNERLRDSPGCFYGAMLLFFYAGVTIFVLTILFGFK